jgi:predicted ATPase/DNA-binding CsgD family transcriptional regulator
MAHASLIIRDGILIYLRDGSPVQIPVDSSDWYAWLQSATVFSLRTDDGNFTVRKERAGNRRGESYWRVYHKHEGRLRRAYAGKSEGLTLERLRAIAATLVHQDLGDAQRAEQKRSAGTSVSPRASPRNADHSRPQADSASSVRSRVAAFHLPAPLTNLIGREQEVAETCHLLQRPDVRMVTLTGTGGVGKTRLALQVAAKLLHEFAGGVYFISLASIRDPDLVMSTIAGTFGVKESAAQPLAELIKAAFREMHMLLILDNFEQILPAAPQLIDLLVSCPRLTILLTSRAALHVSGEQELAVAPLPVPDLTRLNAPADLARVETVRLFVDRAQAVQADFALTEHNARAIAEICVRLDGLPLAIELAAARIKLLPPEALLQRLSRRLDLLTGGAQDLPSRQQTLRNTLQWSYDLLAAHEQRLFRRISIFVGGCILEDAEVVCQTSQTDDHIASVLDGIASLLDKNLVLQTQREGGAPRLVMLETIREFGWECLHARGELEAAREAHARYYLELADTDQGGRGPVGIGEAQTVWLRRLEQEHNNLRAALEWVLEEVHERAPERRQLALRASAALEPFWVLHGHYREAHAYLERALARSAGESALLRARALQAAAELAIMRGDLAQAMLLSQQCLALYRELGDVRGMANSLFTLGRHAFRTGKTTEAIAFSEEGIKLLRPIGEPGEIALALYFLGLELSIHGEYSRGQAVFEEAVHLFRAAGNELMIGATLVQSAHWLFASQGDPDIIHWRLDEGQTLIKKAGSRYWLAEYSYTAAEVAWSEGQTDTAYQLVQESLAAFREMEAKWMLAWSLQVLGRIEVQRGDLSAARRAYEESLALTEALGEKLITVFDLEGLAGVAVAEGEYTWAAQLCGAAVAFLEAIDVPLPPVYRREYEQVVRAARAQLGAHVFAAAWQEGRTMTPTQVLAAHGRTTAPFSGATPIFPSGLTAREFEVLRLVAQGLTNSQIAEQLTISLHTANAHVRSILAKLDVHSRHAVIRFAIQHDLT